MVDAMCALRVCVCVCKVTSILLNSMKHITYAFDVPQLDCIANGARVYMRLVSAGLTKKKRTTMTTFYLRFQIRTGFWISQRGWKRQLYNILFMAATLQFTNYVLWYLRKCALLSFSPLNGKISWSSEANVHCEFHISYFTKCKSFAVCSQHHPSSK